MTLRISENLVESFRFAKNGLIGHWVRWIIMIVVTAIPIVNFISYGYYIKIFKGGDVAPEFNGYGRLFVDGIKLFIIAMAYMIIPLVLVCFSLMFTETVSEGIGLILVLIAIALVFVFGLLGLIGGIRFAKTEKMGEGFNFKAILATIKEIGWGHYFLSYFVLFFLVVLMASIVYIIPLIGRLLFLVILPLILLWQGKYYENLYSRA